MTELPWGHNIDLIEKVRTPEDRLWYARQAFEFCWSRNVLALHIADNLHRLQGKALTNFNRTLPPLQSDLAQQTLKDDYAFDFLKNAKSSERDLEKSMVQHVQRFLLELGAGFAFLGRQHHLEIGGEDFYLDLLFYHVHLHCYIVIELKAGAFKPEHAGKMNFYLSSADDLLRRPGDGPTIGLILCGPKNRVILDYAVRRSNKPIGISSSSLTRALPGRAGGQLAHDRPAGGWGQRT